MVTELATELRACKFPDAKAASGFIFICSMHIKMFVKVSK